MVLQKMGPDFAMSLGFWAVSCGRSSIQRLPTWGNADASRPFSPKPPAKPPRSSEQNCTARKPALPMRSTSDAINLHQLSHKPPEPPTRSPCPNARHQIGQRLAPTATRSQPASYAHGNTSTCPIAPCKTNRRYSPQAERHSVQISSRQPSSFAEPRPLYGTDLAGPGLYHLQDCGP